MPLLVVSNVYTIAVPCLKCWKFRGFLFCLIDAQLDMAGEETIFPAKKADRPNEIKENKEVLV